METKISWAIKAGIIFAVAVVIGVVAFIIKQQYDIFTQLQKIETTTIQMTKQRYSDQKHSTTSLVNISNVHFLTITTNTIM